MKRHLFNAGAVLSLLLGLLMTAAWVRSYWVFDTASPQLRDWVMALASNEGSLAVYAGRPDRPAWFHAGASGLAELRVPIVPGHALAFGPENRSRNRVTFKLDRFQGAGVLVVTPHWVPLVATLILPSVWVQRRRRKLERLCETCGYDLRGRAASSNATCPECGGTRGATA